MRSAGPTMSMSRSMSRRCSSAAPAFANIIFQALSRSGLAPSRLEVEITESRLPRRRDVGRHAAPPVAQHGRSHCARRFRHRLFVAQLFAQLPVRQDQDRQELREQRRRSTRARPRSSAPSSISRRRCTWKPLPKVSRTAISSPACAIRDARASRAFIFSAAVEGNQVLGLLGKRMTAAA